MTTNTVPEDVIEDLNKLLIKGDGAGNILVTLDEITQFAKLQRQRERNEGEAAPVAKVVFDQHANARMEIVRKSKPRVFAVMGAEQLPKGADAVTQLHEHCELPEESGGRTLCRGVRAGYGCSPMLAVEAARRASR